MPEWTKGADCKSAIRGFESHSGLCLNRFDLLIYPHNARYGLKYTYDDVADTFRY